ncbi:MAG: TetR/AcrR family transcriptional regulator [Pseudomonadota bacterium]
MDESTPKRPGRPPSKRARRAILAAAVALLDERGRAGVTMEAVAARAGVGKSTLYRHWPNAEALAMAALMESGAPAAAAEEQAAPLPALAAEIDRLIATFATKRGRQMAQLLAAAEADSELAKVFRYQVIGQSRDRARAHLAEAMARGDLRPDLRPDLDIDTALDLIFGPVFYRLVAGHAPLDTGFGQQVLALALDGLRVRR